MTLFSKHQSLINKAIEALHSRTFYAAYPEHPAPAIYGETADADGQTKFKAMLGNKFTELKQSGSDGWAGQEESPYLQEALKVSYPTSSVSTLVKNAKAAQQTWRKVSAENRAGILAESLERVKGRFFEIAYATMH